MDTAYKMYLVAERGLSDNTVERYRADLDRVTQCLAVRGKALATATAEELQTALRDMLERRKSPLTVRCALHALRSWLKYRAINGEDTSRALDYLVGPKLPVKQPRIPAEHEMQAVLVAIHARCGRRTYLRDIALAEALYASGIRVSELCGLKVGDITWGETPTFLVRGKGAKDRVVCVSQAALGALQAYLLVRAPKPADYVFVTKTGLPLDRRQVRMIVRKWGRWAKLKNPLYPHALRHACATHWLGRMVERGWGGEALLHVQRQLGHADLETTQRYTHLDTKTLKRWHTKFAPARMA